MVKNISIEVEYINRKDIDGIKAKEYFDNPSYVKKIIFNKQKQKKNVIDGYFLLNQL